MHVAALTLQTVPAFQYITQTKRHIMQFTACTTILLAWACLLAPLLIIRTHAQPIGITASEGTVNDFACAAGQYKNKTRLNNTQYIAICLPCTAGTYRPSSSKNESCISAPAGTFVSRAGAYEYSLCSTGSHTNGLSKQTACSPCPLGTYTPRNGTKSCIPCSTGSYTLALGATACTQCSPGYSGSNLPKTASTHCQVCPVGKFSPVGGSISCTPCAKGYYNNQAMRTSCIPCTTGTFSNSTGATTCLACPSNTISTRISSTFDVLSGTVQQTTTTIAATACLPCNKGYTYNATAYACVADQQQKRAQSICTNGLVPGVFNRSCTKPNKTATCPPNTVPLKANGKTRCSFLQNPSTVVCGPNMVPVVEGTKVGCGFSPPSNGAYKCRSGDMYAIPLTTTKGTSAWAREVKTVSNGLQQQQQTSTEISISRSSICAKCSSDQSIASQNESTCVQCPDGFKRSETGSRRMCVPDTARERNATCPEGYILYNEDSCKPKITACPIGFSLNTNTPSGDFCSNIDGLSFQKRTGVNTFSGPFNASGRETNLNALWTSETNVSVKYTGFFFTQLYSGIFTFVCRGGESVIITMSSTNSASTPTVVCNSTNGVAASGNTTSLASSTFYNLNITLSKSTSTPAFIVSFYNQAAGVSQKTNGLGFYVSLP